MRSVRFAAALLVLAASGQFVQAQEKVQSRITITVPERGHKDTILTISGAPTEQSGGERKFITPPLEKGATYTYTFKAVITAIVGGFLWAIRLAAARKMIEPRQDEAASPLATAKLWFLALYRRFWWWRHVLNGRDYNRRPLGKTSDQVERTAHCLNVVPHCRKHHIASFFKARDTVLADVEDRCHLLLR